MNASKPTSSRVAHIAVALAALWLLTGALFKLFLGTPKDLPSLVRDHSPFDWDITFHLAIAIELTIVWLALLKPRWGWPVLAALFVFFEVVLGSQLAAGAESCGCLGEKIKVPPALMMAIDGVLLAGLVLARPWRALQGPGLSTLLLVVAVAVSWAAPWVFIPTAGPSAGPLAFQDGVIRGTDGTIRYAMLAPQSWVGKSVFDARDLRVWVAEDKLPVEGRIVFFRQGCQHCAKHLRSMAAHDDPTRQVLLIEARDELKNAREVDALPQGDHVTLFQFPENLECAFTTPAEVRIEGGTVTAYLGPEEIEKADEAAGK